MPFEHPTQPPEQRDLRKLAGFLTSAYIDKAAEVTGEADVGELGRDVLPVKTQDIGTVVEFQVAHGSREFLQHVVGVLHGAGLVPDFVVFHPVKSIAQATEQEADYTRAKGFSDEFCMDLIEKAVNEHGSLSRPKIDELVSPYLPAILDEKQRFGKIGNLLTKLKHNGKIHIGPGKVWMPGPEN